MFGANLARVSGIEITLNSPSKDELVPSWRGGPCQHHPQGRQGGFTRGKKSYPRICRGR